MSAYTAPNCGYNPVMPTVFEYKKNEHGKYVSIETGPESAGIGAPSFLQNFHCGKCSKEFYSRSAFDKHVREHHNEWEGKESELLTASAKSPWAIMGLQEPEFLYPVLEPYKFACNLCNAKFHLQTSFDFHLAEEHTGWVGKKTRLRTTIVYKYHCNNCINVFKDRPSFNRHVAAQHHRWVGKESTILTMYKKKPACPRSKRVTKEKVPSISRPSGEAGSARIRGDQ